MTDITDKIIASQSTGFTSVESEETILRRMIFKDGAAEEIVLELSQNDFSREEYGKFFRAMQSLVAQGLHVDMASIDNELTKLYGAKGWNITIFLELANSNKYSMEAWQDVKSNVRIVKELSQRRQAIASMDELVGTLRDPTRDIGEILTEIADAAEQVEADNADWTTINDVLIETFEYVEKRQKGDIPSVTTGLGNLDRLIGGFFGGEMTVIAARPSVGKSAFGVNVALSAAYKGFKVGVVSCEMSREGLGQRLFSYASWVDGMSIRRADLDEQAWAKICDGMQEFSGMNIQFLFDSIYVEDVVRTVRRKARRGEMDLLVVDYLQFMETKRRFDKDYLRVGYISHELKRLAKVANIPVIVLAQVNRMAEGRMPSKNELKDSGTIEQDADGIIFLHRPEDPDDPSIDPRDKQYWLGFNNKGLQYIALGVAKQRNGCIGRTCVLFDPALMRYVEIDRSGREPTAKVEKHGEQP